MKLKKFLAVMLALALIITSGIVPQNEAKASTETYSISYDLAGGTVSGTNPTRYTNEESVQILTPSRVGYTFDGWDIATEGEYSTFTRGAEFSVLGANSYGNMRFTAKWKAIVYTITYDYDGGTITGTNKTTYTIEDSFDVTNPTQAGKVFEGWDVSNASGRTVMTNNTGSSVLSPGSYGNVTLKARWLDSGYSINYYLNGGTFTSNRNPSAYQTGSEVHLENPTKSGYTFIGWTDDHGTDIPTTNYTISATAADNYHITANYTIITYRITYDMNDGSGYSESKGSFANDVDVKNYYNVEQEFILDKPTREGYNFAGWTTGSDLDANKSYKVKKGTVGNFTVRAVWKTKTCKIVYDLQGGSLADENTARTFTVEDSITPPVITRKGYDFAGWYLIENGLEVRWNGFNVGDAIDYVNASTETEPSGTCNIKADWDVIDYGITYNMNGGVNDENNPDDYTVEDRVVLETPKKAGYTFKGWSLPGKAAQNPFEIEKGTTGDLSVTANWEPTKYSVNYDLDGGKWKDSDTPQREYTVESGVTFCEPEKSGYTFKGWKDTVSGDTVTGVETGKYGDVSVKAQWEIIKYNITYNMNGGTNHPDNPSEYDVQSNIILNKPTWTGHTFKGWSSEGVSVRDVYEILKGSTGDLAITANWDTVGYSIEYKLNGGKFTDEDAPNVVYGYDITDSVNFLTPVRSGYTFKGWKDLSVKEPDDGIITGINVGRHEDVVVEAQWEPIVYDIEYKMNGANEVLDNPKTYTVEKEFVLVNPVWKGHTFTGWSVGDSEDKTLRLEIRPEKSGITGNLKITAHWDIDGHQVKYSLAGGSFPEDVTVKDVFTVDDSFTLPTPVRKGYDFVGWKNDKNEWIANGYVPSGTDNDVVAIANWDAIVYDVTYDLNGGTVEKENPLTYTVEDEFTLNNPSWKGHTFDGWSYKDEDNEDALSKAVVVSRGSIGARNYRAKFTTNRYSISYDPADGYFEDPSAERKTVYTVDESVNFPTNLLKDSNDYFDYKFAGWMNNKDGEIVEKIEVGTVGDYALTASFAAIKKVIPQYVIEYDLNGGKLAKGKENPASYSYLDRLSLVNPTRKGYVFNGWSLSTRDSEESEWTEQMQEGSVDEEGKQVTKPVTYAAVSIEKYSTGDRKYTAYWKPITYRFDVDLKGGTFTEDFSYPKTFTPDDEDIVLEEPTRRGYEFAGWLMKDDRSWKPSEGNADVLQPIDPDEADVTSGDSIVYYPVDDLRFSGVLPQGSVGDKEIYATWEPIVYSIKYRYNGGVMPNDVSNRNSYTIEDEFTVINPKKEGYKFIGWSDHDSDSKPVATRVVTAGSIGALDLVANWTPLVYSINVNTNGGKFAEDYVVPSTYTIEKSVNLLAPTRTGYSFVDWTINGTTHSAGGIRKGTTGDLSIIANWELNKYGISYDLGGGVLPDGKVNPEIYDVETETFKLNNPVKDGATFAGWTSIGSATPSLDVSVQQGSMGNLAFKANWIPNDREVYKVIADLDGGQVTSEIPSVYYTDSATTIPNPFKTGYDFAGWSVNSSGAAIDYVIPMGTKGDVNLLAQWKIKTYTIKYNLNGGTLSASAKQHNKTKYTVNDSFTLQNPTRKGYVFNGWVNSATKDFDLTMKVKKGTVGNITFTAKWVKSNVPETYLCADLYKTLNIGSKFKIKVANIKGCKLNWVVLNPKVATVNRTIVTGRSVGSTKMICTITKHGVVVYKFGVKVKVQRSRVRTLNTSSSMKRFRGKLPIVILDKTIYSRRPAKIGFEHASGAKITYKVDNPRLVSISKSGVIRGHGTGYTYGVATVRKDGKTTKYAFHFKVSR